MIDTEAPDGADIHSLTRARMTRVSPVLDEAWRYWSMLRTGGDLPRRDALDPSAMSLILGHSMILDRVRPGTVRVRLGGRVANGLMGMEVRGLPIRAFFDLLQRARAADLVERVFEDAATLELDLISDQDGHPLPARMIVLPLRDRSGEITKALAVLVPERVIDEGPRRFTIVRHHLAPTGVRPTRPATRPMPQFDAAMRAPAEQPAGFEEPSPGPVPWLRVVK
ncbi:PAS domain-containing protein [Jannaschia aquimarina]|uniref:PAS domain protein n=1 Tax=Jannaschia aquimarina TaxID=935700 RepID=A0A0D1DCU7_9RHOB|nr:PAS domain-containing protein [Jannaschia aquimarina]KIT17793.1 PAS domain protein [Jannaschia aquimarina]SNT14187.1 hypothetical protein SAMN05421775_106164 [Jannaschia aquimarina]